jgi:hypothetical protein
MFIIAGISSKTNVLENTPRLCPSCGLARACLKRTDSYFSLFFIPLFRVKKGEPFIFCDRCETVVSDRGAPARTWKDPGLNRCKNCGKALNNEFVFCPYCGNKL